MARLPRCEVIDASEISIVHCINRTVRRCFLLGDDPVSGKNFDHRKEWIEQRLTCFAAWFGIDLLAYSILSNHYHLVLRTRPDVVAEWSDTEVARRWLMICPKRKRGSMPAEPTEAELNSIRHCPVRVAEIRSRLSDVSWWMRLLNQGIAQRANRDDLQQGRFWQDRFRSIRIEDEESLLACAAYVELNPIRAAMADTLESSDFTSVKKRIDSHRQRSNKLNSRNCPDAFLSELAIDEKCDPTGSRVHRGNARCSDRGFLSTSLRQYLALLDYTARLWVPGKSGRTPVDYPPILLRLGIQPKQWRTLVDSFEDLFSYVAGRSDRIGRFRSHITKRRFRVKRIARQVLPAVA